MEAEFETSMTHGFLGHGNPRGSTALTGNALDLPQTMQARGLLEFFGAELCPTRQLQHPISDGLCNACGPKGRQSSITLLTSMSSLFKPCRSSLQQRASCTLR